jgi:hypothetical protein
MSPYILSIGISYKISYKDFLYGGNPGVIALKFMGNDVPK